ncbi:phosphatidylinositol 4-phosphate 5-kinase 8-like isoform X1 [Macadamia integrifolia]|uniref:phosphatidylinositol 4-phosphate 5-kinase 8-like isoform X1 n=1 Tax=Macadamia integrifolia TaxID=60698 RepID=UPI001C4FFA07|nr:phosphatidylinositol 4-phosphate 5-kinase 8-like isoform X1 [Macadamia integrifolia]XP_042490915.1 phosphatidylinositol 4-phosphate 5-kinase 8-like isoform X1 [Macadamia integrifolia]XP_042490923.1 phosphatidylinositol 4-phosphate 5-kinase 8-like isoform X1 [Macadamia integrifolia]XP_042490931.1 phosphatidylinositol 4-phosphate 5-kinase 8-like isoform X1 [Macadamia integrifolia]XP_042490941.1 phosphatidylinositol 4-phosphate 5-kinase 8-like isoform X1 [Macadamia integrifolia]
MEKSERHCERVFSNGDAYVGNIKQELPHGKGRYTWSDGTVYEGEWEEGKMTGKGRICWSSGATYEGDFSGNYLHGFGTFTADDGCVYNGAWRMNVQHGLGRKKYSNLDVYEGSWREGVQEGSGRYSWNAGNTYTGNWKAGKMCGRGAMKWENGDLFDGFWLDGLRHGSGYYRFSDGGYYFGTWTKGLKDGKGTFYPVGAKIPSLKKWYKSVGYYDMKHSLLSHTSSANLEDFSPKKPRVRRSLSEKLSIGGLFRSPGRISLRAKSLDGAFRVGDPTGEAPLLDGSFSLSFSSNEGQNKFQDQCSLVYEREYMQGVLIKERVRNDAAELSLKNKWRNKSQPKEQRKKPGQAIFKGHRSYYLMLNLQLGIRYTVGKITPVPMREVRSSDFGPRARIRMYFPRKGSKLTPSHKSIDFYWKDYCPMVFRNLREMFKIDAADYMMSICGGDGLRELSSPGKSGSIFYLSQDERFVIKTQRRSELKILLKMLPNYYNHVGAHDNTLITKFFGLHRITLKHGRKVRFVVMGNMFCTELRIHRRYDLKGSSQGRCTNKHEIDENTTLKDLDLSYVFQMDRSWRKSLFKQISLDCMFLESQHIIDYSLLLGLHFRAPEHLKALTESSNALHRESSDEGASSRELLIPPKGLLLVTHEPNSINTLPGPHIRGSTLRAAAAGDEEVDLFLPDAGRLRVQLGVNMPAQAIRKLPHVGAESEEIELVEVYDVVLYLGIIDILQEYNIKKKIEHAYKSLQFDPLSISAVEPQMYSKRFISFLERVFPDQMLKERR